MQRTQRAEGRGQRAEGRGQMLQPLRLCVLCSLCVLYYLLQKFTCALNLTSRPISVDVGDVHAPPVVPL